MLLLLLLLSPASELFLGLGLCLEEEPPMVLGLEEEPAMVLGLEERRGGEVEEG